MGRRSPSPFPRFPGRHPLNDSAPIRVLIVDDHPVVRDGIRGMLTGDPWFEVVGEAGDGARAVELARSLEPDVVLMDLRMPGMSGVDAIRELNRSQVVSRVLVLTTYASDGDIGAAIDAGATGYLLKDAPLEELTRAIRLAARGETVLSPLVATRLVGRVREPAVSLSDRELEVLRLIAEGCTNREAAARLFISETTVKTHVLHLYGKLGVNDRAAAVAAGFRRGLLELDEG
jgi:DNA-binding NarL/FixJ family response regulator